MKNIKKFGKGTCSVSAAVVVVGFLLVLAIGCKQCGRLPTGTLKNSPPAFTDMEFVCSRSGDAIKIWSVPRDVNEVACRFCGEKHKLNGLRNNYVYKTEFTYRAERDAP